MNFTKHLAECSALIKELEDVLNIKDRQVADSFLENDDYFPRVLSFVAERREQVETYIASSFVSSPAINFDARQ